MPFAAWIWKLIDRTPILLSTAPRYVTLARWTIGQIGIYWPKHPEIFVCGAPVGSNSLGLRENPDDWMKLTAAGCAELLERGFRKAYLILDDHPPIAECNAGFLSNDLPAMLEAMDATMCLTTGSGPVLRRKGVYEKNGRSRFERLPLHEPWKLALHPALWNLEKLHLILQHLVRHLPESQHHPWAFERIGSSAQEGGLSEDLLSSCWRVDGWSSASSRAQELHDWRDACERLVLRASTIALRSFGAAAAETYKARLAFLWHPRIGAYPCFWSGVMKKGIINSEYTAYASFKNRPVLVDGLSAAFLGFSI